MIAFKRQVKIKPEALAIHSQEKNLELFPLPIMNFIQNVVSKNDFSIKAQTKISSKIIFDFY